MLITNNGFPSQSESDKHVDFRSQQQQYSMPNQCHSPTQLPSQVQCHQPQSATGSQFVPNTTAGEMVTMPPSSNSNPGFNAGHQHAMMMQPPAAAAQHYQNSQYPMQHAYNMAPTMYSNSGYMQLQPCYMPYNWFPQNQQAMQPQQPNATVVLDPAAAAASPAATCSEIDADSEKNCVADEDHHTSNEPNAVQYVKMEAPVVSEKVQSYAMDQVGEANNHANEPNATSAVQPPSAHEYQNYWPTFYANQPPPMAPRCSACNVGMVPAAWHCPCAQAKWRPAAATACETTVEPAMAAAAPQAVGAPHYPQMHAPTMPVYAPMYYPPSPHYYGFNGGFQHRQLIQPEMQTTECIPEETPAVDPLPQQTTEVEHSAQSPASTPSPQIARNGLAGRTPRTMHAASATAVTSPATRRPTSAALCDMDVIVRNSVECLGRMTEAQRRFYRDFDSELKNGFYDRKSNGLDPGYARLQRTRGQQQQQQSGTTPRGSSQGDGVAMVQDNNKKPAMPPTERNVGGDGRTIGKAVDRAIVAVQIVYKYTL